ncbi:Linoleate 13S-lipoxygenase 2-1 [Morus notabilis]|uniref:Linoleate 13S-lipoxygenase 2-1 n=1 Tax=Morus notabilis TaxID=981085 RepID=W9QK50_9ROSA|nr:Linoleate 13S-lipoxygenase 2-1 [Morus notabilis]
MGLEDLYFLISSALGIAVGNPSSSLGLKLTIEDHPYAGLVMWGNIKKLVTGYVNHNYPNPSLVETDQELQA